MTISRPSWRVGGLLDGSGALVRERDLAGGVGDDELGADRACCDHGALEQLTTIGNALRQGGP
jgi:hypothetical protein